MNDLRILYRAARELFLACRREREAAEALVGHPSFGRAHRPARAQGREAAMRQASMRLVRRINGD